MAITALDRAARNCFQVGPLRRGAGSIPAALRIPQTVECATLWPSLINSPWMRRCPHRGFSAAIRRISAFTTARVDGRPGGLRTGAYLHATSRRCHDNRVFGVTGNTSSQRTRGIRPDNAANNARSAGS